MVDGFYKRVTKDGFEIMQHVENGKVQHEWLIDDEEHTHWYMHHALYDVVANF